MPFSPPSQLQLKGWTPGSEGKLQNIVSVSKSERTGTQLVFLGSLSNIIALFVQYSVCFSFLKHFGLLRVF